MLDTKFSVLQSLPGGSKKPMPGPERAMATLWCLWLPKVKDRRGRHIFCHMLWLNMFYVSRLLNTDTWHNSKPLRCSWSMEVGKYEVCWVQLDSNTLRKILYVTQLVWIPGSKAQDVMSRVQPNVPSQHSELESGVACRVAVWCCWLWQPMLIHYSHGNLCAL